jgi:chromosome segregation ATPase
MKQNKVKTSLSLTLTLLITVLATTGCNTFNRSEEDIEEQAENPKASRRFQQQNNEQTVVESTISLSNKYSKLLEKHSELKGKYRNAVEEKQALTKEKNEVQAELKQAEKELRQANNLLKETVSELNKWKSNVLGFQQEVRKADQAQLNALYKILRLMGGQPPQNDVPDPNQTNQNNKGD